MRKRPTRLPTVEGRAGATGIGGEPAAPAAPPRVSVTGVRDLAPHRRDVPGRGAIADHFPPGSGSGVEMRRALINSGRLAPGCRNGKRKLREKIATAPSRRQHGPDESQAKHRPVPLEVTCSSSTACASIRSCSADIA
jgi:hypothetical protein